ncbi:MAG TPA: hypothetical protein DCF68_18830 [Cyanothece sp. UBA12306]|nr:hypothetical protein [Cyanothece sp. UBA12306]
MNKLNPKLVLITLLTLLVSMAKVAQATIVIPQESEIASNTTAIQGSLGDNELVGDDDEDDDDGGNDDDGDDGDDNIGTVPEPLTILGAGAALGFGGFFKRKLAKSKKKDQE